VEGTHKKKREEEATCFGTEILRKGKEHPCQLSARGVKVPGVKPSAGGVEGESD